MSRTFFRKFSPTVPRAAGRLSPSGLGPLAATSSVLYAPPPRRGRETLQHTGCRQLQRGKAEGDGGDAGQEGGIDLAFRPTPHAGPPRSPDASPRSIEATAPEARRLRASALWGGRCSGPHGFRLRGHRQKRTAASGARPPFARPPSATVPGRFSLYLYIDMFSSGCRKYAWSSSRNAATRPWERPSLQACNRSSP